MIYHFYLPKTNDFKKLYNYLIILTLQPTLSISRDLISHNIHSADVTEEELREMFESCGTIVNFRFLTSERPDKQMSLLEFTNTSSAICGLVQYHNKEVCFHLLFVSGFYGGIGY